MQTCSLIQRPPSLAVLLYVKHTHTCLSLHTLHQVEQEQLSQRAVQLETQLAQSQAALSSQQQLVAANEARMQAMLRDTEQQVCALEQGHAVVLV